jgi:hypothetical protein
MVLRQQEGKLAPTDGGTPIELDDANTIIGVRDNINREAYQPKPMGSMHFG